MHTACAYGCKLVGVERCVYYASSAEPNGIRWHSQGTWLPKAWFMIRMHVEVSRPRQCRMSRAIAGGKVAANCQRSMASLQVQNKCSKIAISPQVGRAGSICAPLVERKWQAGRIQCSAFQIRCRTSGDAADADRSLISPHGRRGSWLVTVWCWYIIFADGCVTVWAVCYCRHGQPWSDELPALWHASRRKIQNMYKIYGIGFSHTSNHMLMLLSLRRVNHFCFGKAHIRWIHGILVFSGQQGIWTPVCQLARGS